MLKRILFFLITCFLFSSTSQALTFSEEQNIKLMNSALVDVSAVPSSIVGGCVNVITGDFFDNSCDMVIPGVAPITIQRSFNSSNSEAEGTLSKGWDLNLASTIRFYGNGADLTAGLVRDRGATLCLKRRSKKKRSTLKLAGKQLRMGVTNCMGSEIGSHTNISNKRLYFKKGSDECLLKTETGEMLSYKILKDSPERKFEIVENCHPTGNYLKYDYDRKRRLKTITGKGRHGKILYTLQHTPTSANLCVKYNNNHSVYYKFQNEKGKESRLASVVRSDGTEIKYSYTAYKKTDARLTKKTTGDQRFVNVKYEDGGDLNRVSSISAPLGYGAGEVIAWKFSYNFHKHHTRKSPHAGSTTVTDALGNKKKYIFSSEQRLTCVSHFTKDLKVYRKEKMCWKTHGKKKSFLSGNGLTDGRDNVLVRKKYDYDKRGNVLTETIYGNLSGTDLQRVSWDSYYHKEQYAKNFTYTENNHIATEYDGWQTISYAYWKETSLVSAKYIADREKVRERFFYRYDQNGALIEEIHDDGSSHERENLRNVTERHIKKIIPTTEVPIGLAGTIEDYCLDLSTGQEQLISMIENQYNDFGKLICQRVYDCNKNFCYEKSWEYRQNKLQKETDAYGNVITYVYDRNNNCIKKTQVGHSTCHYTYDYSDRLRSETVECNDGLCLSQSHTYDLMGNRTSTTDIYGNVTQYSYDEFGRIIQQTSPPIQNQNGELHSPVEFIAYDCMDNIIQQTDALGNVTKKEYTAWGKPYRIVYPDGSEESFKYTVDGHLLRSTAKNGTYTCYEYDFKKRCIAKKTFSANDEFLYETSSTYNIFHLLTETDAAGNITFYSYDSAGRKSEVRTNDSVTSYAYDSLGRESECRETFGDGPNDYIIKSKQYDWMDRIIEETVSDASQNIYQKVLYSFDAFGNRISTTLFNGAGANLELIEYDTFKNPIKVTDALGNITTTHYDYNYTNASGQKVPYKEVIDAFGNREITISDALGNVIVNMRKNAFGDITQQRDYRYDSCGRKTAMIETVIPSDNDDNKVITEWIYDSCGRITSLVEAKGTPEVKQTRYTYTIFGEKEQIIKPDGTILTHAYDSLGRLISLISSEGSIAYTYTYDKLNHPIRVDDDVHHIATIKSYDSNNRPESEILGNGLKLCYEHDRLGRVSRIVLPDESAQETSYSSVNISEVKRIDSTGKVVYSHAYKKHDLTGKILEAQLAGNAGTLQFTYNLLGKPVGINGPHWNESLDYDAIGNVIQRDMQDSQGIVNARYEYDDLYQLKSETAPIRHQYTYDSLNNRTSKDGIAHSTNALNQLLSDGQCSYAYDPNGNLIEQRGAQAVTYTYDALDRLIKVKTADHLIEYLYDSENRRLAKTINSANVTRYIYMLNCEVGSCNAEGKVIEYRLLGQGKGAEIGAAVAIEIGKEVYIPIHNAQGSVTALLDLQGNAVGVHRYTGFGEETPYGAAVNNPWRFSSKRYDAETGLIFFGRRYYAPALGRWTTPDPIGHEGGINLYCYVLNEPLDHFDLFGLYEYQFSYRNQTFAPNFEIGSYNRNYLLAASLTNRPAQFSMSSPVRFDSRFMNDRTLFPEPPRTYEVGYWSTPDLGIGYTNGICTKSDHAITCGSGISKMANGYKVDVVHNPSGGFFKDVERFLISSRLLLATPVVEELHRVWDKHFDQGAFDPRYLQFCHSEGVNNVRLALMSYDPERAKRIMVIAIAPSMYIDRYLCGDVMHYRSTRDFVPLVDSYGRQRNLATTRVLKPKPSSPIWDHDFLSPTYNDAKKTEIAKFFNSH